MEEMGAIKDNWSVIKETIRREYNLSNVSYRTWVEPLEFYNIENDVVNIVIPSDKSHALNYISSRYTNFFQVIITEMFEHDYDVKFILETDIVTNPEPVHTGNINYEYANLNPKYKFDTFVVGSSNNFAHSACLAVAESPGEVYNPLYLYGGPGLGKTHLMHSIGHFILEHNSDKKVMYVTSEVFTNEVIQYIRSGDAARMNKMREKYRSVDVLMIDDVQFIIGKESTQEEFFHTFNTLHAARKQIILSSDKPPKEIEMLDERFRSRFEWGLIADIQPPNYETKMAILQKYAESCGRHIDKEILNYIATNIKSNIRELEGAFNKIIASTKLNTSTDLTMELVEEALKDMIYPNKSKEITPTLIINVVSEHFGVNPDDIMSKKRNSEFVLPRQIAMYLCRNLIGTSYVNIGRLLGKKDHTTIMHGVNKITAEMQTNEDLKNKIDIIIKKINPS